MNGLWQTKLSGELKENKRRRNSLKHILKDKKAFLQKEIFSIEYPKRKSESINSQRILEVKDQEYFYKNIKLDRKSFRKCKHLYELGGEWFFEWIERSKVKSFLKKGKFNFNPKKSYFCYY